jgi:hypothetical protein
MRADIHQLAHVIGRMRLKDRKTQPESARQNVPLHERIAFGESNNNTDIDPPRDLSITDSYRAASIIDGWFPRAFLYSPARCRYP